MCFFFGYLEHFMRNINTYNRRRSVFHRINTVPSIAAS